MSATDRQFRYWHKRFEYCGACHKMRPINGDLKCPSKHRISGLAPAFRVVRGRLLKGALVLYQNPISAAQAANFLKQWNEEEPWRAIAWRLMGYMPDKPIPYYMRDQVARVSALLSAHANRNMDSEEVMQLLGAKTRTRHRVALEVDTAAEAAALRALLARYGSRREVAAALVAGELRIVEIGKCNDN